MEKMDKNDYTDPACPFDFSQYTGQARETVPVRRVLDKEDSLLALNDYDGAAKLLRYWIREAQELEAGERFAVMVRLRTDGSKKPVAVELKKDAYTRNVTTEGKEGYLSLNGEVWESAEEKYGTNICLKAYTRTAAGQK